MIYHDGNAILLFGFLATLRKEKHSVLRIVVAASKNVADLRDMLFSAGLNAPIVFARTNMAASFGPSEDAESGWLYELRGTSADSHRHCAEDLSADREISNENEEVRVHVASSCCRSARVGLRRLF